MAWPQEAETIALLLHHAKRVAACAEALRDASDRGAVVPDTKKELLTRIRRLRDLAEDIPANWFPKD